MTSFESLRVAIIHDWLVTYKGSERVVEQLLHLFPQADLFSIVDHLSEEHRQHMQGKKAQTSFIQHLPFSKKSFRHYLPLMPLAIEQFDLSQYQLILSSNFAVSKGVITGPDQLHLSYVHSPIRYAWDLQNQYLEEAQLTQGPKSWLIRSILHYMRLWDRRSADNVDHFIANSHFIARRIQKVYRRDATVIYPPVDVESFEYYPKKENFYVTVSRMVPYKKVSVIIEAFAKMPEHQLVVIGDGPDYERLAKLVTPNIQLLGHQSFEVLKDHIQRAKAFLFAAKEDFGIAPVEAQACGTPVIAYGAGGAKESIIDEETGIFFPEQTADSLIEAVQAFEQRKAPFDSKVIRENAERFSISQFRQHLAQFIENKWNEFSATP